MGIVFVIGMLIIACAAGAIAVVGAVVGAGVAIVLAAWIAVAIGLLLVCVVVATVAYRRRVSG